MATVLREKGASLGESVVGQQVEVYWPEEAKCYKGQVRRYDKTTGEHEVWFSSVCLSWVMFAALWSVAVIIHLPH